MFLLFNFDQFCCCNCFSLFFFSSKPGMNRKTFKILSDQQQFYMKLTVIMPVRLFIHKYVTLKCPIPSISHISRASLAADKLVLIHLKQIFCSLKALSSMLYLKTSHRQICNIVNNAPPQPIESNI